MTIIRAALFWQVVSLLVLASVAHGETLHEMATYAMTDDDTKQGAENACITRAGRAALMESDSLVTSDQELIKSEALGNLYEKSNQKVRSYVAGIVKTSLIDESWDMENNRLIVSCSVNVTFDPAEVHRLLLKAQEAVKTPLPEREDNPFSVVDDLTNRAKNLRHGMTRKEVIAYLGEPRGNVYGMYGRRFYVWGSVYVSFSDDLVECVAPTDNCMYDRWVNHKDYWSDVK